MTTMHGPRAAGALTGDAWLPGVRLMRAEFLKLTRRRGLMITAAALTAGAVIASATSSAPVSAARGVLRP